MTEILLNLTEFGLKTLLIVIAIIVVFGFILTASIKAGVSQNKSKGFTLEDLSKKLKKNKTLILSALASKKDKKKLLKTASKEKKSLDPKPKMFVLEFDGNIKAEGVTNLAEEISMLQQIAEPGKDQVTLMLKSPGGMVSAYGLAAAELLRLKATNISLNICVDQVAASGGYLMACTANKIIAAPFALIGSIGVVMSLPNFNKILKKNDVDYEVLTAGKHKRSLTVFGENTDEGREKTKEQLNDIHNQFKGFVAAHRPNLDLDIVATGEVWLAEKAKELGLVDLLQTSQEFLYSKLDEFQILSLKKQEKKKLMEKLAEASGKLNLAQNLFKKFIK